MYSSNQCWQRIRLCSVALVGVLSPIVGFPGSVGAQAPAAPTAVVSGVVKNGVTGEPMRVVVVRAVTGNVSTISNDAGRYRLELPLGEHRLEARQIGYKPASVTVAVVAGGVTRDISLQPIVFTLERVIVTAEDAFARELVAKAIARKQQLRGTVHDYRFHGEVRFVGRDPDQPADSSSSVKGITESQTEVYWEQPNQFQETMVARRQTGNVTPERNLIGVGNILDLNTDRILFARFELASPIADDALRVYDYRVLDTLVVGGRRTYRLSVEPRPNGSPAFVGMMDIVDSTFDVVGIDVGVNPEVRVPRARDIRYQQRFRELEGGRWMPYAIELSVLFDLSPLGKRTFRHTATLSNFRFNEAKRPAGLGEYRMVVLPTADRPDSAMWAGLHVAPLTPVESLAWKRIDSVANVPPPPATQAIGLLFRVGLGGPDFFHFNRVDGAYVGAGKTWYDPEWMPGNEPTVKLGYGTGSKVVQYRVGDRFHLSDDWRMWIGASYRDETVNQPTLTSPGYNPTLRALVSKADPFDYYRDRALTVSFSSKVMKFTDAVIGYTDAHQSSLSRTINHPPLRFGGRDDDAFIPSNPPIDDGHLGAFTAGITIDPRPLLKQGGRDLRFGSAYYTRLGVTTEWSPRMSSSDFDYRRAEVRVDRRQESFGMGVTTFLGVAGIATSAIPLQRAFSIDGGPQVVETRPTPFNTLGDVKFTGSRTGFVSLDHDFDRLLFTKSRLPLVRDIPFTLSVNAAMFWAEFPLAGLDAGFVARRQAVNVTRDPYREVGFTVGNLTPMLSLINLSARFAWQVSRYPTTPFRFSLGLSR